MRHFHPILSHSGVVPVQVDLSSLMIQINNQISEIKDSIAKGQAAIEARVDSTESRLDTQMQQLRADINTKTQEGWKHDRLHNGLQQP